MKGTFRWIDKDNNVHEYRFTNNICDGFFSNDKLTNPKYKGRELTEVWRKNLPEAGFIKI